MYLTTGCGQEQIGKTGIQLYSMYLPVFLLFFAFQQMRIKKYKKEGVDEMAERNLKRCDSFCLKIFVAVMVVVAWGCAILSHVNAINMGMIGWIIVLSIFILSIIRTLMFVIIDSKGV